MQAATKIGSYERGDHVSRSLHGLLIATGNLSNRYFQAVTLKRKYSETEHPLENVIQWPKLNLSSLSFQSKSGGDERYKSFLLEHINTDHGKFLLKEFCRSCLYFLHVSLLPSASCHTCRNIAWEGAMPHLESWKNAMFGKVLGLVPKKSKMLHIESCRPNLKTSVTLKFYWKLLIPLNVLSLRDWKKNRNISNKED